jgi:SanA protein
MLIRAIFLLIILAILVLGVPRVVTGAFAARRTYTAANVPARRVAVVFGAGLWRNGEPTPVLQDRVKTAAALYFAGKVEKLLMSGDNRFVDYNEPQAMFNFAIELGVPEDAIVLDYAGRSTYETCYRAGAIFGLEEAILVTQAFHLPRALYTCNALGLDSIGVAADQRVYRRRSVVYWNLREVPATANAFWEIYYSQPLPVLGEAEPIFPTEIN